MYISCVKNKHKYQAYSAAALAFLTGGHIQAEVIYTDIVPDAIIDTPGSSFELDLNNDGQADFSLYLLSSAYSINDYYLSLDLKYMKRGAYAAPANANAIAGFLSGGGAFAFPYHLNFGVEVGPYAFSPGSFFDNFLQEDHQTLRYYWTKSLYASPYFYYNYGNGVAGEWLAGEGFAGLQLKLGEHVYYGWVRLFVWVGSNDASITVKDYAFESKNDIPITTFIAPSSTINTGNTEPVITCIGNTINIFTGDLEFGEAMVKVYDLQGSLVYMSDLDPDWMQITLDKIAVGMYTIQLSTSENKVYTENILISRH